MLAVCWSKMPRYKYTALDINRKKVKGAVSAENAYSARKQLRGRSLHPIDIKEASFGEDDRKLFGRGNKNQVVEFTKQLATLINSGIKLTEALAVLTSQVTDVRFRSALTDIRDRLITGESFSEALADYSDYFDVIYVSMVRVGEMTGSFGPSLTKIADFMEKRKKVESKIVTAMIYPIILIVFGLIVMLVLTGVIIPKIGEQIRKVGQELPAITEVVLGISDILRSWQWMSVIIIVLAIVVWAVRKFVATPKGAILKDRFLLSLPIVGKLIRKRVVARFSSTLSTLLSSGLPMAESLKVVSDVTGNAIMSKAIRDARDRILSGADISTPLRDSGVIDPTIAHMVSVGERSGELELMLQNISESLEADTDVMIERLSSFIEPIIIIFIASGVAVLALSMILPIIKFSSSAV